MGSVVVAHRLSCSLTCRIFLDQGSNPCPMHWQVDSLPPSHQESPVSLNLEKCISISQLNNFRCSLHSGAFPSRTFHFFLKVEWKPVIFLAHPSKLILSTKKTAVFPQHLSFNYFAKLKKKKNSKRNYSSLYCGDNAINYLALTSLKKNLKISEIEMQIIVATVSQVLQHPCLGMTHSKEII